jgi:hypothetical protein
LHGTHRGLANQLQGVLRQRLHIGIHFTQSSQTCCEMHAAMPHRQMHWLCDSCARRREEGRGREREIAR